MTLPERLKMLRNEADMTQKALSEKTGLPLRSIINYENGIREPNARALVALETAFSVSGAYLLGYTNSRDRSNNSLSKDVQKIVSDYSSLDQRGQATVLNCLQEQCRLSNLCIEPEKPRTIQLRISEQAASAGTGIYLGPDAFLERSVIDNVLTQRADFAVPVSGDSMEPQFCNGDLALVSTEPSEIGDIVVVFLQGEGYIKKLGKNELISFNPKYKPIPLDDSLRVCGKVIGILDPDWIQ